MKVRALSAAAAVAVVSLCSTACNPATKAKVASGTVPAATATAAGASATTSTANQAAGASAPAVASASSVSSSPAATAPAPAAGGGTSIDVCGLLTSAQASSINGVTYGATTPQQVTNGYDSCTYKNNGSKNPVDIQDLTVQVISLAVCYTQLQQADGPGTPVSGVGDEAFGYSIGIIVKVGSRCLDVSGLTDAELQNNYAPDVAMAKIIISKLS